jgi:hypothetical protein
MAVGLAVGLVMLAVIRLVIEPVVPGIGSRMAAAGALASVATGGDHLRCGRGRRN